MRETPTSQALIALFNQLFVSSHRTELVGGAAEPLYRPAAEPGGLHRIHFTRDYCASALHEVAHWCIAGQRRRRLLDYGYWYVPDGRNSAQQRSFESVEVKPQALEWIFSQAAGTVFRLSADNLNADDLNADNVAGDNAISEVFKERVWRQALAYCDAGLNGRARQFAAALAQTYGDEIAGNGGFLNPQRYCRDAL